MLLPNSPSFKSQFLSCYRFLAACMEGMLTALLNAGIRDWMFVINQGGSEALVPEAPQASRRHSVTIDSLSNTTTLQ